MPFKSVKHKIQEISCSILHSTQPFPQLAEYPPYLKVLDPSSDTSPSLTEASYKGVACNLQLNPHRPKQTVPGKGRLECYDPLY